MTNTFIATTLLWVFIYVYAILGSIDFGAGFWAMVFETRKKTKAGLLANRFLSPSWEVTNVFLVLLVISVFSFFPSAAYTLGTVLLIPGSLILIFLTLRSAFMVFSFTTESYRTTLKYISGISGLLVPALLVSVLPITSGGFIEIINGQEQLLLGKLFRSPSEYTYLAFGLSSQLFLSALFLSDYAREALEEAAYRTYRSLAIWLGPMTLAAAVLTVIFMEPEAQWLKANIMEQRDWFSLSVAAFIIGYSALWWPAKQKTHSKGRPRIAVLSIVAQYGLATFAYASAHWPYIVYPMISIEESITNSPMLQALLISFIVGSLLLLPFFIYFWRLFMKDRSYLRQK